MMSTAEQELKRLLHYGLSTAYYEPGNRLSDFYIDNTVSFLLKLIEGEKLSSEAANCILKAFSDNYSPHPVLLVNALAVCAKQTKNAQLREAAYKAVKTVCTSSENLFLFVMFIKRFTSNAKNGSSIWGNGCRKVLKEWYLNKDVKTLGEMVGEKKKSHGWNHSDIIKLIHLKTEEPARAAIVKYILFGIKSAKMEFSEVQEANELLNYFQAVEDLKHLTDELQAASLIEKHRFNLNHVPPRFMKSKEVWSALVANLPLVTLLKNLERIGYMGYLKPNSHLVDKIVDALNDRNSIFESHLHPAQVFITMRNYEASSKYLAVEMAKKKRRAANGSGEAKKVVKVPRKPSPKIISALHDLFASTCKLFLPPTGLRYMVAVDLRNFSPSRSCHKCPHVSVAQAAVVTVLCLLHADRNVSVNVAGPNETLVPVDLATSMTVQQGVTKLKESSKHRLKLSTPTDWALKKKEEHDVFVIITDVLHRTDDNAVSALQKYREEMKISNAKLVLVLLKNHGEPTWVTDMTDGGVFVIVGFDGHVPRLIEAFSRGAF